MTRTATLVAVLSLVVVAGCGDSPLQWRLPLQGLRAAARPARDRHDETTRTTDKPPTRSPPESARRPPIRQWRIPFGQRRREETAAYAERHYGVATSKLNPNPRPDLPPHGRAERPRLRDRAHRLHRRRCPRELGPDAGVAAADQLAALSFRYRDTQRDRAQREPLLPVSPRAGREPANPNPLRLEASLHGAVRRAATRGLLLGI
jgi:hypothetical protein